MAAYTHILFATDLLEGCLAVGRRAVELAEFYQARLTFLHVVEYMPLDLDDGMLPMPPNVLDEELIQEARTSLRHLAAQLGVEDAEQRIEVGSTKSEILRVCEDTRVDLLVIGSHSRHGLALLLGSTSKSVVGHAPCDVFAVRVKD